jgi:hypothetical protein
MKLHLDDKSGAEAADLLGTCVAAIEIIGGIVKNATVDRAADVLHAIQAIVSTIRLGFDGTISPGNVRIELDKMHDRLKKNDIKADCALDAKFDKGG